MGIAKLTKSIPFLHIVSYLFGENSIWHMGAYAPATGKNILKL
jgi:hypothetical protein